MARLSTMSRLLAQLEERVEALAPRPEREYGCWFGEDADTVRNPATGEVLTRAEFDRLHPDAYHFTLDLGKISPDRISDRLLDGDEDEDD